MRFKIFKKTTVGILLVSVSLTQLFFGFGFFQPKQAKALFGVGDFTFNTEIWNPYDIAKEVAKAIAVRVAVNYSNEYLTRFVNQVSDKYKIRNFLYYDRILSDFYLNRFISDKIDDPDLRQVFRLMEDIYLTGNAPGLTAAQRREALIPQLKTAIADHYANQGGIPTNTILNPPSNLSPIDYYSLSYSYYQNPPGFTERNLRGQFGAFQSNATTAAQLEIMVGNGLKAGRVIGGTCDLGDVVGPPPVTYPSGSDPNSSPQACSAAGGTWQESAIDLARGFIDNPSFFVEGQLRGALDNIFETNFDPNNPFSMIGSFLGDFIFKKLNLDNQTNVLYEGGSLYSSDSGNPLNRLNEIDLDQDGFPEGYDIDNDGNLDVCYHGQVTDTNGETVVPIECKQSSQAGASGYFTPFCQSIERSLYEMQEYLRFITTNRGHISGQSNFKNKADAVIWARRTSFVTSAVESLLSSVRNYRNTSFDPFEIDISRYSSFIGEVQRSLSADGRDLDLTKKRGDGGGGIDNLIKHTTSRITYLQEVQAAGGLLAGRCDNPDIEGIAGVPLPPPIVIDPDGGGGPGSGQIDLDGDGIADGLDINGDGLIDICFFGGVPPNCIGSSGGGGGGGNGVGNDPGAPSSISGINWIDNPGVGSWSEEADLSVSFTGTNNDTICLNYPPESNTWPVMNVTSVPTVGNAWVVVWRNGAWHAATWEWMKKGQGCKSVDNMLHADGTLGGILGNFTAQSGDLYGFMVSTHARNGTRSSFDERSNIVPVIWP